MAVCLFQINWTATVETLLLATGLSDEDRSALDLSDMPVSLQCRDFLPELCSLISSTSPRYTRLDSFLFFLLHFFFFSFWQDCDELFDLALCL